MITGIIALITALPELFKLLNRLGNVVERFMKYSEQNNINKWITDLEDSIDKLEKASTPEEKLDAAQSIVSAVRNL